MHVIIDEQRRPAVEEVIVRCNIKTDKFPAGKTFLKSYARRDVNGIHHFFHFGRPVGVVKKGGHSVKAFCSKELFIVKAATGFFKNGVAFLRLFS